MSGGCPYLPTCVSWVRDTEEERGGIVHPKTGIPIYVVGAIFIKRCSFILRFSREFFWSIVSFKIEAMKVILKFTLLFFFNSQIRLYFMLSPSFFFLCLYVCCIATSIFVCCIHAVFFLTFSFRKFVRNLFFTFICLC